MVVVQTPLRISFAGGGTDFPQFFLREEGCVITSAINRYIFVIVKRRFDENIRVGYTKTELVSSIDELEHELVRESLRKVGVTKGIEIGTMGDVPSAGSGMGSSSTVTVGLLNALYHYIGEPADAEKMARDACEIERIVLRKPIGLQDQYIASYGGLRFIRFCRDGSVSVERVDLDDRIRRRLSDNLMLFFTNITRKAETVLAEQVANIESRLEVLRAMKNLVVTARQALEAGELDEFGLLLKKGWELKKLMASKVTNGPVNEMYQAALSAGALGGKITGAGGGGFLLLYCPRHRQDDVRMALRALPELDFGLERYGTRVILDCSR